MRDVIPIWAGIFLLAMVSTIAFASQDNGQPIEGHIEKYYYEAMPLTRDAGKRKEVITAEYLFNNQGVKYKSRIVSSTSIEMVTINMGNNGEFFDGMRIFVTGKNSAEQRISVEGSAGKVEQIIEGRIEASGFSIPGDKKLAVDGSLLMLLRFFPFNTKTEWTVFIVDFSGESITLTIRQAGTERITVKAGEFECFRMEVIVHIPILRPRLTYWITADEPHFLVKNIGKRGPFTPNYVTMLTGRE